MIVTASIAETFAVFEDPRNLARITPPWLNFKITTQEPIVMAKNLTLDYKIKWLGVPMPWRTLITAYEPPYLFVDEQIRGPYILWRHRHTFRKVSGGVEVADAVEYQLPLGPAGAIAQQILVGRQLLAIFRFRQKAIGQMLHSAGKPIVAPRLTAL